MPEMTQKKLQSDMIKFAPELHGHYRSGPWTTTWVPSVVHVEKIRLNAKLADIGIVLNLSLSVDLSMISRRGEAGHKAGI